MDAMTLERWVPFRDDSAAVRCRLFAFPHAGGNAAFYRPLRRFMPPEIDFCPVELPGRAARLDEMPCTAMSALMQRLQQALPPLMAVPFGFFGHSVGAGIAYEAARQLRSPDGRSAMHLFVSGRGGPGPAPTDASRHASAPTTSCLPSSIVSAARRRQSCSIRSWLPRCSRRCVPTSRSRKAMGSSREA